MSQMLWSNIVISKHSTRVLERICPYSHYIKQPILSNITLLLHKKRQFTNANSTPFGRQEENVYPKWENRELITRRSRKTHYIIAYETVSSRKREIKELNQIMNLMKKPEENDEKCFRFFTFLNTELKTFLYTCDLYFLFLEVTEHGSNDSMFSFRSFIKKA